MTQPVTCTDATPSVHATAVREPKKVPVAVNADDLMVRCTRLRTASGAAKSRGFLIGQSTVKIRPCDQ